MTTHLGYILRQSRVRYALANEIKKTIQNFNVKDIDKAYKDLDTNDIVFALSSIMNDQTNNELPKKNKLP